MQPLIKISENVTSLLEMCSLMKDDSSKQLSLASIITKVFVDNGKEPPVIVGGRAVSVYSLGQYGTVDTDMISAESDFCETALTVIGYKRLGKDYYSKEFDSYVEFPSGRLAGSYEKVIEYKVEETELPIYLIGIEDIILDRVDSFVATNDLGSKEWALRLLGGMYPLIDWAYIHKEANVRDTLREFEKLQRTVKRYEKVYKLMRD